MIQLEEAYGLQVTDSFDVSESLNPKPPYDMHLYEHYKLKDRVSFFIFIFIKRGFKQLSIVPRRYICCLSVYLCGALDCNSLIVKLLIYCY